MRITCLNGCCILEVVPYLHEKSVQWSKVPKRHKAGVFLRENQTGKILIVQSRGKLWGPPKGTMESDETPIETAVRELEEETGLVISPKILESTETTRLKTRTTYFWHSVPSPTPVTIQNIPGNDVNGIGWVHPSCIANLAKYNRIQVTKHLERLLREYTPE
jgi:8-oxo-dGTP pyrophosphatase MutT (NUDIX family)